MKSMLSYWLYSSHWVQFNTKKKKEKQGSKRVMREGQWQRVLKEAERGHWWEGDGRATEDNRSKNPVCNTMV